MSQARYLGPPRGLRREHRTHARRNVHASSVKIRCRSEGGEEEEQPDQRRKTGVEGKPERKNEATKEEKPAWMEV
ncbi:hypothetical protein NDU88_002116 [Pleurodeles waltl]|uniref:Uncharacterized protein n=1 Tax=Pleurodeles waltl TaxID=8319 RepID=A0AAV7M0L1_PLEWA|nr:hypothetical protein NDU88_002116 [Pleurodeles waltl]